MLLFGQVSDHVVQLVLTAVNSATLVVLLWYSLETRRLRVAAQEQLEALAKPCLTLSADLRQPDDAILSMYEAVGNTIARSNEGNFAVQNIGSGIALNVRYVFNQLDTNGRKTSDDQRYLQSVAPGQPVRMPEPINAFQGSYAVVFNFESIGGKAYRSTVQLTNRVLTAFKFESIRP